MKINLFTSHTGREAICPYERPYRYLICILSISLLCYPENSKYLSTGEEQRGVSAGGVTSVSFDTTVDCELLSPLSTSLSETASATSGGCPGRSYVSLDTTLEDDILSPSSLYLSETASVTSCRSRGRSSVGYDTIVCKL